MRRTILKDGEGADALDRDTGSVGGLGPRRDDQVAGPLRAHARHVDCVVPEHAHFRAQLPEVLKEVVGEAVVVVDQQDHGMRSL